jgi:Protein of unknown function (DUF3224)
MGGQVSMSKHADGTFKVEDWQEEEYGSLGDGRNLSRASVRQAISGDIEGQGSVEWLMCYRPDKTADFVGLQQVDGRLGDRSGSFVLRTSGVFDGEVAKGELTVVPGSGTGELDGIDGRGEFKAPLGSEAYVSLDYDLG